VTTADLVNICKSQTVFSFLHEANIFNTEKIVSVKPAQSELNNTSQPKSQEKSAVKSEKRKVVITTNNKKISDFFKKSADIIASS